MLAGATCSTPGTHVFTLTATEGSASASDSVAIVVVSETVSALVRTTGETLVGVPDEEGLGTTTGIVDGQTTRVSFQVPEGATRLDATLTWEGRQTATADLNDFRLALIKGASQFRSAGDGASPETVTRVTPAPGPWRAQVEAYLVVDATWSLAVDATTLIGDAPLPAASLPNVAARLGDPVDLAIAVSGGTPPYSVAWEATPSSRRYDDGVGTTFSFPFAGPTLVRAKVTDVNGFEVLAEAQVRALGGQAEPRPMTVVAVIDSAFSPYHYDFLGHQHPWNRDADATNDHDFHADPASYIAGHPGAIAIDLTIPAAASTDVDALRGQDSARWDVFPSSNLQTGVKPVWFPGTKVVAALRFGGTFQSTNGAHGTASASVAAGNWHGSCPECLFVLISGDSNQALRWVASQPWIDVVTNSYGHSVVGGVVRDNIYLGAPFEATRDASEAGQVVVFSAGNGLLNAFDVPMFTYWSSEKGPDWIVTVGAATPSSEQTYSGAGKPVDISSIGSSYPASGGVSANGTGTHSGTSNAAPVTAGYFAKVLQAARETLADVTPGHAAGIVAAGAPVACAEAWAACPLADGLLTRRELQDLVFHNVLPSTPRVVVGIPPPWPTTPLAYHYQGHGVLSGLSQGAAEYTKEWTRMVDAAHGRAAPFERPAGERAWFVADSSCRQRVWGSWSGGYHDGSTPTFDPATDAPGMALYQACSTLPVEVVPTVL